MPQDEIWSYLLGKLDGGLAFYTLDSSRTSKSASQPQETVQCSAVVVRITRSQIPDSKRKVTHCPLFEVSGRRYLDPVCLRTRLGSEGKRSRADSTTAMVCIGLDGKRHAIRCLVAFRFFSIFNSSVFRFPSAVEVHCIETLDPHHRSSQMPTNTSQACRSSGTSLASWPC